MQSVKAKAFSLLSRRSYFSKQLKDKLLEKEYKIEEIETLIIELRNQGWINDQELAERYVQTQRQKGYGARVIIYKLREKAGPIDLKIEDDIEEVVAVIKRRYFEKLTSNKNKVIAALLRRGFSYDLINKALTSIKEMPEGP